jgi:hypothetical protein
MSSQGWMNRSGPVAAAFILASLLVACNSDRYTVTQRKNENKFWVKVALRHDGHTLYANCNNYKAAGNYKREDVGKIYLCWLYVGQTVQCTSFPHRESGYDLICGNELVKGELTTSGGNDLLLIEKEDEVTQCLTHNPGSKARELCMIAVLPICGLVSMEPSGE